MLKALRSLPLVCLLLSSFVFANQPSVPAPDGLLTFETNRGQTAPQVRYLARSAKAFSSLPRTESRSPFRTREASVCCSTMPPRTSAQSILNNSSLRAATI